MILLRNRIRPRAGRRPTTLRSILVVLVCLIAAPWGALADLRLPPRRHGDPPMRIVRVMSVDPECGFDCPEWISAEGMIRPGTADLFARAIGALGGRRLPVLLSSRGGSVADAVKMGALIRERHLAVAVARTLIANCPERSPQCPGAKGQATTTGAVCASACPLILAGGVERLVSAAPEVGVHQMTTIARELEGAAHLPTVKKIYEESSANSAVEAYLTAMGIGDPVMTLLRKTRASGIRWLSPEEIAASHLATLTLGAEPILASGANGLNGHAAGAAGPELIAIAKGSAGSGDDETVEASFSYRPGGGTIEAVLMASGAAETARPAAGDWTLTAAGGDAVPLRAAGPGAARAILTRASFCALAHAGKFAIELAAAPAGGSGAQAPVAFDFAGFQGAAALVAEACA